MSSLIRGSHPDIRAGKDFARRLSMMGTAVDAPGEAPSSPAIEPSAAVMSSVPNCSTPPFSLSRFMTCTRCPASISSHCEPSAVG
jgi:hypothetical protein